MSKSSPIKNVDEEQIEEEKIAPISILINQINESQNNLAKSSRNSERDINTFSNENNQIDYIGEQTPLVNHADDERINNQVESSDSEETIILFGRNLNLTKSQLTTTILLITYFFLSSAYYSLLAPFFPSEAIKKGISQTQVGFIFGIFEFVILILSPIFGKYLQVIGIRFLFVSGIFLSSGSEILFGFLDKCPNGFKFFIMCIACRCVTALGSSMGMSYAIVGHYFPNKISTIVAILEVFNGLGLMIGPLLGGTLYEIGGFTLPFFFMGGLLFIEFIIAFFIFPDIRDENLTNEKKKTLPVLPLVLNLRFILTMLMLLVGSISIGFMEPCIQLHLAPLNLRPIELGSILFFPSLIYLIVTPIVGHFCDKNSKIIPWFMLLSSLVCAVSYSFLGPIPFYKLPLNIWIFFSGFLVYGLGFGGLTIPVYSELTQIALTNGYPNDLRTQGLISGLFGSIWSLGALLGPTLGGIVVDQYGFSLASFGIVIMFLTVGSLFGIYHFVRICCYDSTNNSLIINIEQNDSLDNQEDQINQNTPLLSNNSHTYNTHVLS